MTKTRTALLGILTALLAFPVARAATYQVDPQHSSVGFSIHHLVGRVDGTFDQFKGSFNFDPKKPQASSVEFTAQTTSVDTHNERRDNDLRSPNFFEVAKYPTMTFKSTKLVPTGKNKYKLTGDLTIRGITHPQTFEVEYGGQMIDPWNNLRAGFTATTTLDRKAYGIIWNKHLDTGGYMLGDEVQVTLQIEATTPAPAAKESK